MSEGGTSYSQSSGKQPDTFNVTQDSSEYVVNWYYPSTTDQTRTFTVAYTVVGGLIIGDGGSDPRTSADRFFWKSVGPQHDYPVGSSTVTVYVPQGATVDTYVEPYANGANGSYSIASDQKSVTFTASNIPANQYFETGLRFTHGFVPAVQPSWQAAYAQQQTWNDTLRPIANLAAGAVAFLLLILGLGGVYLLWLSRGRDPKVGPVPTYLSEPPSDLPAGLAGTLVDEKADMQDIIATLVDLARRGAIDMQEKEKSVFGLIKSKDFIYRRRDDFSEPLRPYESLLIREMFGHKSEIDLDDLREKFYTAIPKLQRELYKEAVKEGLFPASPQAVRTRWMGLGIAGIVLSTGVGFCAMAGLAGKVDAILCPFVSLGLVSVVMTVMGRVMPAKTRKGAEEAAKWDAFRAYLHNAERYKDLKEATDQFDRYLPFAIAFGLERSWVSKFSRIPSTPIPPWYYPVGMPYGTYGRRAAMAGGVGTAGPDLRGGAVRPAPSLDGMSQSMFGSLNSMSEGLFSMLNSTSRVFQSAPSSSGSGGGGFSGGGFSGGGGGGGGGAGFG